MLRFLPLLVLPTSVATSSSTLSCVDSWANTSSVLGLIVSIVGFGITLRTLFKTKSAAEAASIEAARIKEELRKNHTITDFSAAVTICEEIKRLQRLEAWNSLPDRYSELRKKLIVLKAIGFELSDDHKSAIQNAITTSSKIEHDLEKIISGNTKPDNVKFNRLISLHVDTISEILAVIVSK